MEVQILHSTGSIFIASKNATP